MENTGSATAEPLPTELGQGPIEPQSEIEDYLAVSQQRRRVLPRGPVGLGAGLGCGCLRLALSGADSCAMPCSYGHTPSRLR